jgi:serine/threonine protein kinase
MLSNALVGQTLGQYYIEKIIGEGGMACVYRAYHKKLDMPVAIKVLLPEYASKSTVCARFEREAKLQFKLRHPNIVRVFDLFEEQGILFMVMDLVEGLDLLNYLQKQATPLSLRDIQRFFLPVLDAVGYAHDHNIIHRDIKPSNVLLEGPVGREIPKIMDFGIAKALEGTTGDTQHTKAGALLGSLAYLSPEQALQQHAIDHRVDIYALGVTLFELLTGRVPFVGDTLRVVVAHISEMPPKLCQMRPDLPSSVEWVISTALSKNPNDRFAHCRDFHHALITALHNELEQTLQPEAIAHHHAVAHNIQTEHALTFTPDTDTSHLLPTGDTLFEQKAVCDEQMDLAHYEEEYPDDLNISLETEAQATEHHIKAYSSDYITTEFAEQQPATIETAKQSSSIIFKNYSYLLALLSIVLCAAIGIVLWQKGYRKVEREGRSQQVVLKDAEENKAALRERQTTPILRTITDPSDGSTGQNSISKEPIDSGTELATIPTKRPEAVSSVSKDIAIQKGVRHNTPHRDTKPKALHQSKANNHKRAIALTSAKKRPTVRAKTPTATPDKPPVTSLSATNLKHCITCVNNALLSQSQPDPMLYTGSQRVCTPDDFVEVGRRCAKICAHNYLHYCVAYLQQLFMQRGRLAPGGRISGCRSHTSNSDLLKRLRGKYYRQTAILGNAKQCVQQWHKWRTP